MTTADEPVWQEMPEGWAPTGIPSPEKCPIGTARHTWRMTIVEGSLSFDPVEKCTGSCEWWEGHDIGDIDLGVVRLTTVAECDNPGGYHINGPCEHSVWLVPVQVEPGDWPWSDR